MHLKHPPNTVYTHIADWYHALWINDAEQSIDFQGANRLRDGQHDARVSKRNSACSATRHRPPGRPWILRRLWLARTQQVQRFSGHDRGDEALTSTPARTKIRLGLLLQVGSYSVCLSIVCACPKVRMRQANTQECSCWTLLNECISDFANQYRARMTASSKGSSNPTKVHFLSRLQQGHGDQQQLHN